MIKIVSITLLIFVAKINSQVEISSMTPVNRDVFNAIIQFYQYDSKIPLDEEIVGQWKLDQAVKYKIVFTGANDSRVPGYLSIPKQDSTKHPCILLLHGVNGNKELWWEEENYTRGELLIPQLTELGFAVVTLDAAYHGERIQDNGFVSPGAMVFRDGWPNRTREMYIRTVVDYRRLLDYLATRPDIDISKIGTLGHSMGGMMTYLLTVVDSRIRASVSCVGPPMSETTYDLTAFSYSDKEKLAAISPFNFASSIKSQAFLMLMGRNDAFHTIDEVEYLFELISSPTKKLIWFDSGHVLPNEYVVDAVKWFKTHLNPTSPRNIKEWPKTDQIRR